MKGLGLDVQQALAAPRRVLEVLDRLMRSYNSGLRCITP